MGTDPAEADQPADPTEPRPTLGDLIADELDGLAEVERTAAAGATTYARAGRPFAHASATELDVRLDALLAPAALRTPDTTPSDRGAGWVHFAPRSLDRFAADRAASWVEYAWRHAPD